MKPFINLFIGGMFCIEIMSPFMLGYLNQSLKNHSSQNGEAKKQMTKTISDLSGSSNIKSCSAAAIISWKYVDPTKGETGYSDSKSLAIKEDAMAFQGEIK
ncbi:MAG: hypothetical protein ACXVPQ_05360 [Bacteroidia bacterium]